MADGLVTPYDILTAYSCGEIGSAEAILLLPIDGYRDLLIAMCDTEHALPRPSEAEVKRQLEKAMPLLLSVLDGASRDV